MTHRMAAALVIVLGFGLVADAATTTSPNPSSSTDDNGKIAPPEAGEVQKALGIVREVYRADYAAAKTPEDFVALCAKLQSAGVETINDSSGRFALFSAAKEAAVRAGRADLALAAVDEMDKTYNVDTIAMKAEVLIAIARGIRTARDHAIFVVQVNELMDEACAADRFDQAQTLSELAVTSARKSNVGTLVKEQADRAADVKESMAAFDEFNKALLVLNDRPDDPAANQAVGRYRCFNKGDWQAGLPNLVKGTDAESRQLAQNDIAGADNVDVSAKVAVGDGWWNYGQKQTGTPKRNLVARAAVWYRETVPFLSGLEKAKAEKRIADATVPVVDRRWIDLLAQGQQKKLITMVGEVKRTGATCRLGPQDQSGVSSAMDCTPPFQAECVAATDSTNIRLRYAKGEVIFNWEVNQSELRFTDFTNGRISAMKDKGKLNANEFVTIRLVVTRDAAEVFVNGESRGTIHGDYSQLKDKLSIFSAGTSVVTVKSFKVIPNEVAPEPGN